MLIVMGFGLTTIYPEWFALQHGVPVGDASNIFSVVTLVMIPAGFTAGALVARGWRDAYLLAGLMLAAIVISLPMFVPGLAEGARIAAMLAWMVVQGAGIAVVMAALPRVVADPMQGAAAAGLLSQIAAIVTFVTPLVWQPILQSRAWPGFIAVVACASVATWLVFPRRAACAIAISCATVRRVAEEDVDLRESVLEAVARRNEPVGRCRPPRRLFLRTGSRQRLIPSLLLPLRASRHGMHVALCTMNPRAGTMNASWNIGYAPVCSLSPG